MKQFLICGLAAIAMAMFSQSSQAAMVFTFNRLDSTPGTIGNYATLKLEDTAHDGLLGGIVKFTFSVTNNVGVNADRMMGIAFNSSLALTNANVTYNLPIGIEWALSPGPQKMDGFGKYSYFVGNPDNKAKEHRVVSGSFTINTGTGNYNDVIGLPANVNDNLKKNAFFASHLYTLNSNGPSYYIGTGSGTTLPDITIITPVPAPPALLLAVTGMGCMGLYRRFRKAKTVA